MKSRVVLAGLLLLLSSSVATLQAAGETLLVKAIMEGDRQAVSALLQQHVDVNAPSTDGSTALHWAADRNDLDSVDLLIRAGADVAAANRYGATPLLLACNTGSAAMISRLLDAGADPNSAWPEGETALMAASRSGHGDAVSALLARGAVVNAVERSRGQTALMWAAAQLHPSIVKTLIDHGADLRARSGGGLTALLFAIRAGGIDTTRELLNGGADLTETAQDGTGVVGMAIINAHFELAAMLLDKGADPNAPDPRGSLLHALAFVRRTRFGTLARVLPRVPTGNLDSLDLARVLLEHGANPNVQIDWKDPAASGASGGTYGATTPPDIALGGNELSFVGATPFWVAARNVDVPLMRMLADHGADPRMATRQNVTPLMVAAGFGMWPGETPGTEEEALEAVRLTYQLGNDPLAVADYSGNMAADTRLDGGNAMHGAATRGANSIVRWLLEKGVPLDLETTYGWTPLIITRGVYIGGTVKTRPETEKLLIELMKERGLPTDAAPERSLRPDRAV